MDEGEVAFTGEIIQRLLEKNPERDPLSTAFNTLTTTEEIQQFYREYIEMLRGKHADHAEDVARENIGYVSGYFNDDIAKQWREALALTHPVFDNAPLASETDPLELGKIAGRVEKMRQEYQERHDDDEEDTKPKKT